MSKNSLVDAAAHGRPGYERVRSSPAGIPWGRRRYCSGHRISTDEGGNEANRGRGTLHGISGRQARQLGQSLRRTKAISLAILQVSRCTVKIMGSSFLRPSGREIPTAFVKKKLAGIG